jgi:mRNA-degrading endonuclease toxin of MazEF toxin-antitoxin module
MKVSRGDVILLDHPYSTGAGSKVRPVLVVQCDRDNVRLTNTIVVMITRTIHRVDQLDTQLLIDIATPDGRASGLKVTSAVNCLHLFTVHEQLIRARIGALPPPKMREVDACLKAAIAFPDRSLAVCSVLGDFLLERPRRSVLGV